MDGRSHPRCRRRDPEGVGDVLEDGRSGIACEGLQAIGSDAGEVGLGVAVLRQVLAGDAHAPDLYLLPALLARVQPGRLVGEHLPELVLAIRVEVVAVVRDTQVAAPGAAPIAEEQGERTVAGLQGDGFGEATAGDGTDEVVERAVRHVLFVDMVDVVPEGQRGPGLALLVRQVALNAARLVVPSIEAPGLVGALEGTATEAPQEHVLAVAQHGQVAEAVRVDVERIGADDGAHVGGFALDLLEAQTSRASAAVVEERSGSLAAGEEKLGSSVVVTVEGSYAPADEVLPVAIVGVFQARCRGLLDEGGNLDGRFRGLRGQGRGRRD